MAGRGACGFCLLMFLCFLVFAREKTVVAQVVVVCKKGLDVSVLLCVVCCCWVKCGAHVLCVFVDLALHGEQDLCVKCDGMLLHICHVSCMMSMCVPLLCVLLDLMEHVTKKLDVRVDECF
jgi:hypothetical protein